MNRKDMAQRWVAAAGTQHNKFPHFPLQEKTAGIFQRQIVGCHIFESQKRGSL